MNKKFQAYEISVKVGVKTICIIYGWYSKGGFIAIPSMEVCIKMSDPTDVTENALNIISQTFGEGREVKTIATAICEHWKFVQLKKLS